jgi:hypothetical protein
MKVNFRARIEIRGIKPYVPVSAAHAAKLTPDDWRGPMPVLVHINGEPEPPHRINLMPAGDGGFFLYLDATVRKASGTKVGDAVRVGLAFNADYRGGPDEPMPRWFSQALGRNPAAKQGWSRLPPSRQ